MNIDLLFNQNIQYILIFKYAFLFFIIQCIIVVIPFIDTYETRDFLERLKKCL